MKRRQSGVALITAVLIVALAAIASAAILSSASLAIHRTQNLQESELAWWYAAGVEAWTKTILSRDSEINRTDSLRDIWATPVAFLPVDEGGLSGGISDLQGRYNLNNLGVPDNTKYQAQLLVFTRLFALATETDEFQARALASAIRDYIDSNSEPTGTDGAEDADYLGLSPPRRVPNRMMASVSELLAVRGVTPEIYQRLLPHLCALPQDEVPINVNTATPLLMSALMSALSSAPGIELQRFLEERIGKPAESVSELFNERKVFDGRAVSQSQISQSLMSTSSSYFELRVDTFVGSRRLALYSFLHRPGTAAPAVYGRSTFTE